MEREKELNTTYGVGSREREDPQKRPSPDTTLGRAKSGADRELVWDQNTSAVERRPTRKLSESEGNTSRTQTSNKLTFSSQTRTER